MASLENRDIDDLSAPDFERMVYLIAIVKVSLGPRESRFSCKEA